MNGINAELSITHGITAKLSASYSISATVSEVQEYYLHGVVRASEEYDNTYEVTNSFDDDIIVPTKNKYLTDDIVIKKVPVSTTANESGGYTLNVGG